jgi:high frequency lysogenization protein
MSKTISDRTLALAGIFQAAYLVNQIATKGMTDTAALQSSINSLFKIDADTVDDVFAGVEGVATGLSVLIKQLAADRASTNLQITKYVIGLLHLEKKLIKHPDMLQHISDAIHAAFLQAEHFNTTHENVLANLAETYKGTISTLTPRIMVQGEHGYINNPDNANKVRALLLAGIRSAVLWHQCGGSRLQILLNRRAFITEAEKILGQLRV